MNRRRISQFVGWGMAVVAYSYLGYRLYSYDDYGSLWLLLSTLSGQRSMCLVLCVAMMPLNLMLEALKWRVLLRDRVSLSLSEAQCQVYVGLVGAFVTPYRAGEYPARIAQLGDRSHWRYALVMGVYGSVVMTMVILLCGLFPAIRVFSAQEWQSLWWAYLLCALSMVVIAYFYRRRWLRAHVGKVFALSLARYICFMFQLFLMLCVVGIDLDWVDLLERLPLYYLLVTFSPNMPIVDVGIRGCWALFVFRPFCQAEPLILVVVVGMWVVNTVLPMLIGSIMSIRRRLS